MWFLVAATLAAAALGMAVEGVWALASMILLGLAALGLLLGFVSESGHGPKAQSSSHPARKHGGSLGRRRKARER